LISIKSALNIADYVVTEAGFGSDLGGFKFIDILSRNNLNPDLVVINVTIRALKYHGCGDLVKGFSNLDFHIKNMNTLSDNILVVLNKFDSDDLEDIKLLENYLKSKNINFSECDNFNKGSLGSLEFAFQTLELLKNENKIHYLYELEENLDEKIKKVLNHMGASEINYTCESLKKLKLFNNFNLPICIAKTHKSISDDEKLLGYPKNYTVTVKDIKLSSGAGYIVVYLGNIITLPGLTKNARLYD
jgi:formate--tetrahydrofolate ligase